MTKIFVSAPKAIRLRNKVHVLPEVALKKSPIPKAGMGVFVMQDVPKGGLITEYGGRLITHAEGNALIKLGKDTHLLTVTRQMEIYDGRIHRGFPRSFYLKHHLLGSFANDPYGTGKKANATFYRPYPRPHKAPPNQYVSARVFLRAKRPLKQGEEVLVDYGTGYRQRHFDRK